MLLILAPGWSSQGRERSIPAILIKAMSFILNESPCHKTSKGDRYGEKDLCPCPMHMDVLDCRSTHSCANKHRCGLEKHSSTLYCCVCTCAFMHVHTCSSAYHLTHITTHLTGLKTGRTIQKSNAVLDFHPPIVD